jgi:hypothetical protein
MRHDPGLAASPPVRYRLIVEGYAHLHLPPPGEGAVGLPSMTALITPAAFAVERRRDLVARYEETVRQIRALPGFSGFLSPPSDAAPAARQPFSAGVGRVLPHGALMGSPLVIGVRKLTRLRESALQLGKIWRGGTRQVPCASPSPRC